MRQLLAKHHIFLLLGCIGIAVSMCARAENDDDQDENHVHVAIQGPVQACNTTATPPTVQILGLTIDVSQVSLNSGEHADDSRLDRADHWP